MEKPSRSHDLGIMTDAHNHNTSKNSLGNELKHAVLSHGGESWSIFHGRHRITAKFAAITDFAVNLLIGAVDRFSMRTPFGLGHL